MYNIHKTKSPQTHSSEKNNKENSLTSLDQAAKEDHLLHKRIKRMEQFKNVCKKFTSFFFSRVGLCFVVVGYVTLNQNSASNNDHE